VRFASLNYQLQHRVHYQYMMEGYDQQWLNADKTRTVTYNSLPTGTYRLKVKAFLLESPENYDMRELEITVPPYFLMSKNAIWIYMLLAGALSLMLMFWRQRRIMHHENIRQLKLSSDQTFENEEDRKFIEQLKDWLEKHYSNSNLKVDEMVAITNMSRTSFHNKLNDLTGQTPEQFLSDFRLKKAINLLETTSRSVIEVAQMTGFGNALEITRTFKLRMGITPDNYRKHHTQMAGSNMAMSAEAATDGQQFDETPQTSAPENAMPTSKPTMSGKSTIDGNELTVVGTEEDATDEYEIIED